MLKKENSLTAKLIIAITTLIFLVTLVLYLFFIQHERRIIRDNLREMGISLANNLAYNSEYGVLTANLEVLSNLVSGIMEQPDVAYCLVHDSTGKVLAFSQKQGRIPVPLDVLKRATEAKRLTVENFKVNNMSYLSISVPIVTKISDRGGFEKDFSYDNTKSLAAQRVGVARVIISFARSKELLAESARTTSFLALVVILIAIIIVIIIMGIILLPIKKLMEATQALAQGNLDFKIVVKSKDELGTLALAFNRMTESLKKITVSRDQLSREVLERKKAEDDLALAYAKLKEAQGWLIQSEKMDAVGRLASGVAHEVKNPLGIVLQGCNYLQNQDFASERDIPEVINMMISNVKRADNIVRALVDFSRAGDVNLKLEKINSIIDNSLLLIQHMARMENIEIINDFGKDLPDILADKGKMEQVFVNVLSNAIQAIPKGGTITIRTYLTKVSESANRTGRRESDFLKLGEDVVAIEVEDTGVGVAPENLVRMFEPFFTTKDPGKGTGLGLSVTRNIIDLHKGSINVESQLGKGTKIIIWLKVFKAE